MQTFEITDTPDGLADCRPSGLRAVRITEEFRIRAADGNYTRGEAGDYLLKHPNGTFEICPASRFDAEYVWVDAPISGEPEQQAAKPASTEAPRNAPAKKAARR